MSEIRIELLDKHRGSRVRRMDFLDSYRVVSVTLSTLLRILSSRRKTSVIVRKEPGRGRKCIRQITIRLYILSSYSHSRRRLDLVN